MRERAVRMVIESRGDYEHETAAIKSVATKLGITTHESLRKWVRQAEVDGGVRQGKTTEEIAEIKRLRREVTELRRANEILKAGGCRANRARRAALRTGLGSAEPKYLGCDLQLHSGRS